MDHCLVYLLAGATATGKTDVARVIALETGWPLLSADAMLVYRGMDVGTAKPPLDQRQHMRYAGIDCVEPHEPFSAGAWMREAGRACREAAGYREPLLVTGGTGLYLNLLLTGLDRPASDPNRRRYWMARHRTEGVEGLRAALRILAPGLAATLADGSNPRRLIRALESAESGRPDPLRRWTERGELPVIAGLRYPRETLHARIVERAVGMWNGGLLDEVRLLRQQYPVWSSTALQAIGYREALEVLEGRLERDAGLERMIVRTRQLAKRQETWLRRQLRVEWVDVRPGDEPAALARRVRQLWSHHGPANIPLSRFDGLEA